MLPETLSHQNDSRDSPIRAGEPFLPGEAKYRSRVPPNDLSRHMKYLRRRNRWQGPWHVLAIVFGMLLALGMAGYFSR